MITLYKTLKAVLIQEKIFTRNPAAHANFFAAALGSPTANTASRTMIVMGYVTADSLPGRGALLN
jgi:hypothetical protein